MHFIGGIPRRGRAITPLLLAALLIGCSEGGARKEVLSPQVRAARQFLQRGQLPEAMGAYREALRTDAQDATALREAVSLLLQHNRLDQTRELALEILRRNPRSAVATLALAQVAYRKGDRKTAVQLLDQAGAIPLEDSSFPVDAARLYEALGEIGKGAALLEAGRSRGFTDPDLLRQLGNFYVKLNQLRRAEQVFRQALSVYPQSGDLQREMGRALLMLGRGEEAERFLRGALTSNPKDPYALYYLASIRLRQGKPQEAIDYLTRSLQQDDSNPKAHFALARTLQDLGRSREADEEFERHRQLIQVLYHRGLSAMGGEGPADSSVPPGTEWDGPVHPAPEIDNPESAASAPGPASRFYFRDVAGPSGITLKNVSGTLAKNSNVEVLGSGACWIDYDGDGWLDLFLPNGRPLPDVSRDPPRDALYRNLGNGTFRDVTALAGIRDTGWGLGCAVGDYDNDGDSDLYVTNWGPNALFRNNGNGTFTEVGKAAGVADPGLSASAAFADYDRDGFLDLLVTNYLDLDRARTPGPESQEHCRFLGMPVFCGPRGLPMATDRLYRNRGDGTFEDVTSRAGLHTDRGYYSLGVVWGDVDDDGNLDFYVATDSTPNLLYRNNGDGTFSDVATEANTAYSEDGREQAGMGTDMADYDNDGDLDIVVANFSHDTTSLYRQDAPWQFTDVSYPSGIGEPSLQVLKWGIGFFDFDNDGFKDLFVADGHVYPQIDRYELGSSYREKNQIYLNRGDGTFEEVGASAGPGMSRTASGRGAAFADYDNDGDVDVLINNIDDIPTLLRNETGNRSHWIGLQLVGTRGNRDAIGSRVTLTAGGGGRQMAEVHPGTSYLSSNDPRILFGLGHKTVESVDLRIRWPDGSIQELRGLPVDRYHRIVQPGR